MSKWAEAGLWLLMVIASLAFTYGFLLFYNSLWGG